MAEDGVYSTADMYLAALLLAKDYSILTVDRSDSRHIHFKFDSDDGAIDDVIRNFTNGDEEVNASRFVESIRKIKALIHAG